MTISLWCYTSFLTEVTLCKFWQWNGVVPMHALSWLSGPNVGPKSLESVCVGFPFGSGEDVGGGYQLHVHETGLLDGIQVLSFQESTSNSSSPKIHVCLSGIGDRFVYNYVGEIQTATRF